MKFDKGQIVLSISDLEMVASCMYTLNIHDAVAAKRNCLRCNSFREMGKYIFLRSFRGTNIPSTKTLINKYDTILLDSNINNEERKVMVRKDVGILNDIVDFATSFKNKIDLVNQNITLNFKEFKIQDNIDTILCINGEYYITRLYCEDHNDITDVPSYNTFVGSYWLRNNYHDVSENGIYHIILHRGDTPTVRTKEITIPTEDIKSGIEAILDKIRPEKRIKTEAAFALYKKDIFKNAPKTPSKLCYFCMECFQY